MGDNGNPHKKHSIDEIIEHMTTDIQMTDGQYVPLGFTPPSTPSSPHVWSEYTSFSNSGSSKHSYGQQQSVIVSPGKNALFLSDPSVHHEVSMPHLHGEVPHPHNFYYEMPARHNLNVMAETREVIGTMVDSGGNIVSIVYSGSEMTSPQSYRIMACEGNDSVKHSLGSFIPYQRANVDRVENHMKDYGLFNGTDTQQQSLQNTRSQSPDYQDTVSNRAQLIENFVGNWVPNQSGTYSPFGSGDNRQLHSLNQRGVQTLPLNESDTEQKGVGRGARKARIVAEVRPMRPTYSDVLTKSAPTSVLPAKCNPNNSIMSNKLELQSVSKSKVPASKNSNGKRSNKSNVLKRQLSSGSDDHNGNGNVNSSKIIQNAFTAQKPIVSDLKHNNFGICVNSLPRKWVSLDDLDDKQIGLTELDEGIFKTEDLLSSKTHSGFEGSVVEDGNKKAGGLSNLKCKNEHEDDFLNTTLNNHKPSAYLPSGKGPGGLGGAATKRPIHINNNLGTSTWGSGGGTGEKNILKGSGSSKNCRNCSDEKKGNKSDSKTSSTASSSTRPGSARSSSVSGSEKPVLGKRRGKKKECQSHLAQIYRPVKYHIRHWGQIVLQIIFWFFHLLSDVLSMSGRLFVHLCAFFCDWLCMRSTQAWKKLSTSVLHLRLLDRLGFQAARWNFWRSKKRPFGDGQSSSSGSNMNFKDGFPPGLENNISLPATGEEAMRRLLACKGKDPYSILGVTPHCTDDDIKKYYKRQAVLVHPDKNSQPGAEEAFKILVHAFELIGEPERRSAYDRRVAETQQVEQAWSELNDLLSQLHKKMEYAANTIRCTNCGKRHRRIHLDRPCYAARFCAQCKIHHNAREGDIWAESSMFGFLWHYYACMDGGVYDITEWAACQADNLRHLRANTHSVQYRIVLGKQSQQQPYGRNHGSRTSHRNAPESNSEPDLEDFLNNLYNQPGGNGGSAGDGGRSDQGRNRKKGKRKK